MQWRIHVSDARVRAQREYRLSQAAVRIGRAEDAEVRLDAADISRVHCTLSWRDGAVEVADSSRNGTFVREPTGWQRVHGTRALPLPLTLRAGDWTLAVAAEPEHVPASPVPRADTEATWEKSILIDTGALPTQREAIMVFDLCESSVVASHDDRMAYHLKQRLAQIAESVLDQFAPRFFKSTGDGFLATFAAPAVALDAAIALEQRIQQRNQRTANLPLHYRIALHHGKVWMLDAGSADIHGNDVNIAFRLEGVQPEAFANAVSSLPRRDRILCSRAFLAAVPGERLAAVLSGHVVCGEASLKGIAQRIVVHWLRTPFSFG